MKIAILSTRGIPNNYGGFEQFAEYISVGLVQKGHEVTVYSPMYHQYSSPCFNGVQIKHVYSPEPWLGGAIGSFFYDYLSLKDALLNDSFDIIYDCGYTSIIPAYIRFAVSKLKTSIIVTNMDGLEYKRTKFNPLVRSFIFWEEKQAVKLSHALIADNVGIQQYLKEKYNANSEFIPYGANVPAVFKETQLEPYCIKPEQYYLLIARMEPENNIEMIIEGYINSISDKILVIIGNTNTKFGKKISKKYQSEHNIKFVGGIYKSEIIDALRHFSALYFHGHSVGGTNPSLLEAMAAQCLIAAHDNSFNRTTLNDNALFFTSPQDVAAIIKLPENRLKEYRQNYTPLNLHSINTTYTWENIVTKHEVFFKKLLERTNTK